jgi:hypothetical protein
VCEKTVSTSVSRQIKKVDLGEHTRLITNQNKLMHYVMY